MLAKIESKEHAKKVIDHVSKVFMILGILQIIGSFTVFNFALETKIIESVIGIVYLILAFLLRKLKSPIIALILLSLSLIEILFALMNLFGLFGNSKNAGIPIMAVAFAIASVQAIQATLRYNQKEQTQISHGK